MTAVDDRPSRPRDAEAGRATRRTDIQGLRALAVGLVLLYHAGVPWLHGGYVGVDVFFVISGYVVTSRLALEARDLGRVDLLAFWARRARRLVPAAAVATVATVLLTALTLPVTRWATIAGDAAASAAFVMNLRLTARSIDYLASSAPDSPLQHMWSLGVEAQSYVAWGLLLVLSTTAVRRVRSHLRRHQLAAVVLGAAAASSLILSAWTARHGFPAQYFSPVLRFWEIALGGLLAWHAARPSVTDGRETSARRWAGVVGLAAVATSAVLFTGRTTFPGFAALLPVAGAGLVLWGGESSIVASPRWLSRSALVRVGDLSYSLYLWHWPLLVAATALWAEPGRPLSAWTGVIVVLAAVGPAWTSRRWVEPLADTPRPLRPRWPALVTAACLLACGASAWGLHTAVAAADDPPAGAGAAALGSDPTWSAAGEVVDQIDGLAALATAAEGDVADVYGDGCHQDQVSAEPLSCVYGDPQSAVTIALVGDSHAAQWQPALRRLAEERHWRLETSTKSACPWAQAPVWLADASSPYPSCARWVDLVTERLRTNPPDVILTSSGPYAMVRAGKEDKAGGPTGLAQGLADTWAQAGGSSRVIALVDTPYIGIEVPDCLASRLGHASDCAVSRVEAVAASSAAAMADAAAVAAVDVIDMTDYVCPRSKCAPVIGGLVVYRDSHHLTASYARTLAGPLQIALEREAPELFR